MEPEAGRYGVLVHGEELSVLFWIPQLAWSSDSAPFGGHMVQMEMIARHVASVDGVSVRVCRDSDPSWDEVDVVHAMGINRAQAREVRRRGIPLLLSVIYLGSAYWTGELDGLPRRLSVRMRVRKAAVLARATARNELASKVLDYSRWAFESAALFEQADVLLPASGIEADQIVGELGVSTPVMVVPNGVDERLFCESLSQASTSRDGVLYVGRIEPHKNQLRLIEALASDEIPVVIVGPDHPHHGHYATAVRDAAARHSNVEVVGPVPHDQLPSYYRRARVHALPSHFETTGLVSLEAGLCGCNIVTTSVGYAHEYFENMAWYCDPYNVASIRSAVKQAYNVSSDKALRNRILSNYTWKHAAEAALAAYRRVLTERT